MQNCGTDRTALTFANMRSGGKPLNYTPAPFRVEPQLRIGALLPFNMDVSRDCSGLYDSPGLGNSVLRDSHSNICHLHHLLQDAACHLIHAALVVCQRFAGLRLGPRARLAARQNSGGFAELGAVMPCHTITSLRLATDRLARGAPNRFEGSTARLKKSISIPILLVLFYTRKCHYGADSVWRNGK